MKKLLARIKQWNNLNAGLTLVEIIVTMLILVVIALPILGGFIVAARANAMAKDLAYARDAAENVVEVANSGGKLEDKFGLAGWGCTVSGNPEEDDSFSNPGTTGNAGVSGSYP
ncbi:MAG: prepilin-type N-terminal cleavage/methylation domain-containing protein [Lachnospiraceae bacterium]|nr:prepilin-type N-terminal cleavage/methylation domain-containing protein [Lachnospiraceae bacterium]